MSTNRRRKSQVKGLGIITGISFLFVSILGIPSQAQNMNRVVDLGLDANVTIVGVASGEGVQSPSPGQLQSTARILSADISGDGVSDLITAMPLENGSGSGRQEAGKVQVVLGQQGITSGSIVDLQTMPPALIVYGAAAGDRLGSAVAFGDFNGDGVKDLIIGAPRADTSDRTDVGKAYVIFGGSSLTRSSVRDMASATTGPDVTLIGWGGGNKMNADRAGTGLAAGDFNGDGIDDIAVGAPGLDGPDGRRAGEQLGGISIGDSDGGAVFVFYGSRNVPSGTVRDASMGLPAGVNAVIYGRLSNVRVLPLLRADLGDALGIALAMADVNGDSLVDIIAGGPNSSGPNDDRFGAGAAYVILGRQHSATAEALRFDVDQRPGSGRRQGAAPDVYIYGADVADSVGSKLAAADLNGDNRADIILGIPTGSGPNNMRLLAGEIHVIFGAATLTSPRDLANGADFTVYGADPGDQLGFSIATGNVGGDATRDLVIGAPTADGVDNSRNSAGEVQIVYGRAALRGILDLSTQPSDVTIVGASFPHQAGFSVAAGNFDGNGLDDLIINSPFASSTGMTQETRLGLNFVVFGGGF